MISLFSLTGVVVSVLLVGVGVTALTPVVHATCLFEEHPVSIFVEEIDQDVEIRFTINGGQQHTDYAAVVKDIAHEFNLSHPGDSSTRMNVVPDKYLYHDGRLVNLEDVDAVVLISHYKPSPSSEYVTPFVFATIDPKSNLVGEGKEVEGRTDLFSNIHPKEVRSILMDKIPEVLPQHTDFITVNLFDSSHVANKWGWKQHEGIIIVGMGDKMCRIETTRETQAIIWGSDGRVSRLYVGPEDYDFPSQIKGTYSLGDRSEEVKWAQMLLNWGGIRWDVCKVADSGPGSPGNEVAYFGEKTRAALACFQKKHEVPVAELGTLTQNTYTALFDTYWHW